MANPYYNASGVPSTSAFGYSAAMRGEFANVAAGFALLPATLTANKAVIINSGGTGMTVSAGNLTLTKDLTVSNTLTFTGTDGSSVNFGTGGTVLYSGGSLVTTITGTANEITASAATGAVALSLPAALTFTGKTITGGVFTGVTSINGMTLTASTGTITLANGKTLTISNTMTLAATDGSAPFTLSTRQELLSGSGATYTTPPGARQLIIRMIGGGGGGGGASAATVVGGSNGGFTSFDNAGANIKAVGGIASPGAAAGYGATSGTGTASLRVVGNAGQGVPNAVTGGIIIAGTGGGSFFGGGAAITTGTTQNGASAANNSGAGGSGAQGSNNNSGGGGQAGEYLEYVINNPVGSYLFTIGAGGAGGVSTNNGGAGGSGRISVEERY